MKKIKNIYNCVVNIENDNERMGLLVFLHLIGYKVLNFDNLKGLYHLSGLNKAIVTDEWIANISNGDKGITEEWVTEINEHRGEKFYYKNEFVFCENAVIFEAITAINKETDYAQWFNFTVNDKIFWIQACYDKIGDQVSHKEALKTLKKATVEEIKEHFKNGYTED